MTDKPVRHAEPTLDSLGIIFRNSLDEGKSIARSVRPALEAAKQRVLECGWTALRARKIAPSNIEFGKWLEKYGPDVRRETVWRWMQTAQRYAQQLVGSVVAGRQQLPPLTPNHLKLFLQLTDGKTSSQIEADIGLRDSRTTTKVKRDGPKLSPEEQLQADLLVRASAVRDGAAFCQKNAGKLEDRERALLAWAAFDILTWVLPDGKFQHKGPIKKKAKPLDKLIAQHCGGRA